MAIRLTKTSKVIFAISIILLSVALGFLVWKVNQDADLDPTDSDAGDDDNGMCHVCCTAAELADGFCSDAEGSGTCTSTVTCGDGAVIRVPPGSNPNLVCPGCNHAAPGDDDPVGDVDCNVGSQCDNKCYWPEVAYCNGDGTCTCNGGSDNECDDDSPKCTPDCPEGYTECPASGCTQEDRTHVECSARCDGCDNLYYNRIACQRSPERENLCSSMTLSPTTVTTGSTITITASSTKPVNYFSYTVYNRDHLKADGSPAPVCITGYTEGVDYQGECPSGTHTLILFNKNSSGELLDTLRSSDTLSVPASSVFVNDANDGGQRVSNVKISTYFQEIGGAVSLPNEICQKNVNIRQNACVSTTISPTTLTTGQSATITSTSAFDVNRFSYAVYNRDHLKADGTPAPVCSPGLTADQYQGECPAGTHSIILADSDLTTLRRTGRTTFSANQVFVADANWNNQTVRRIQILAYFQKNDEAISLPDADCLEVLSFVLPGVPAWDITKRAAEQCIDENTADPTSELTYTITVRNLGTASGTISKIEDVLDTKLSDVNVLNITSPGVKSGNRITWTFSPAISIAAGSSRVFTYKVVLSEGEFGNYRNTVTLTPVGSSTITASASIDADCEVTELEKPVTEPEETPVVPGESVPQTGLFDTTASRILAGFALLIVGAVIYNLPNNAFVKKENFKYRDKFEKRVANR